MSGSATFFKAKDMVMSLYKSYKDTVTSRNKKEIKAKTLAFTSRIKAYQSMLTDPLDLLEFDRLLLKLGFYSGVNRMPRHDPFLFFSPRLFHATDPRCKECTRILKVFNISEKDKNYCTLCYGIN